MAAVAFIVGLVAVGIGVALLALSMFGAWGAAMLNRWNAWELSDISPARASQATWKVFVTGAVLTVAGVGILA